MGLVPRLRGGRGRRRRPAIAERASLAHLRGGRRRAPRLHPRRPPLRPLRPDADHGGADGRLRPLRALAGFVYAGPAWAFLLVALVWGATIVGDSAQFSAAVTELADQRYVGTALALQLGIGFGLTIVTLWLRRCSPPGRRLALGLPAAGPRAGGRRRRDARAPPTAGGRGARRRPALSTRACAARSKSTTSAAARAACPRHRPADRGAELVAATAASSSSTATAGCSGWTSTPRAEPVEIDTGFATRCNNDHGISPDGRALVISDATETGPLLHLHAAGRRRHAAPRHGEPPVLLARLVAGRRRPSPTAPSATAPSTSTRSRPPAATRPG